MNQQKQKDTVAEFISPNLSYYVSGHLGSLCQQIKNRPPQETAHPIYTKVLPVDGPYLKMAIQPAYMI